MSPFLTGLIETVIVASLGALLLYARRGWKTVVRCLGGALVGYVVSFPILTLLVNPVSRAAFWSGVVGVMLGVVATGRTGRVNV